MLGFLNVTVHALLDSSPPLPIASGKPIKRVWNGKQFPQEESGTNRAYSSLSFVRRGQLMIPRWGLMITLTAAGCLVGLTNILAPFHEAFHVASAAYHGESAEITSWSTAVIHDPTAVPILAGWTYELVIATGIAIIASIVGRRARKAIWITGGFSLGYALVTWLRGFTSYDFNGALANYITQKLIDKSMFDQVWNEVHPRLMARWGILGGLVFMTGAAFVITNAVRQRKSRG
jgi:hypothetical protein